MKLRKVIKGLAEMDGFTHIEFHDFGMPNIMYALSDLLKYIDNDEESVMDAMVTRIETRSNIATVYGFFKEYLIERDGK